MRRNSNDRANQELSKPRTFNLNQRVAYRMAAMGAQVVANASRLRESGDLYSAQVALRSAAGCAVELDSIMKLIEDGDFAEAAARIEHLSFPAGIRKA